MKKCVLRMIGAMTVVAVLTGCGDGDIGDLFGGKGRMTKDEADRMVKTEVDRTIKTEVEKLVKQHMRESFDELLNVYDIDMCTNFVIGASQNGVRKGTVDVALRDKKSGKMQKVTYEFKYEGDTVSAGVKDPSEILKLLGMENLANLVDLKDTGNRGNGNNKAEEVLGLDKVKLSDMRADLDAAGKLVENFKNLSFSQIEVVEKVSGIVTKKIQAEWLPQLHAKARRLGVKEFSVELDEEDGVVLLPDDKTGSKYSGLVSGKAKADGDEAEFAFRLGVKVANGNVTYEVKQ